MRVALAGYEKTHGTASMWTRFFTITIFCLLFTFAAFAQSDRGTITGIVTDPSSAAVAGAKIEVRNTDNGNKFDATTNTAGIFTVTSVPSGKYNVTISAPGFKTASETGVEVLLDQTVKLTVALEIGQTSDTVSVVAQVDMLKTDNAELSMNVERRKTQ